MTDARLSDADLAVLREQLGRDPQGALRIERRCATGHPLVIRTHPLAATRGAPAPFPTLFWLTCPVVHKRLARLEQVGGISEVVEELKRDPGFRRIHDQDQAWYAARRWSLLDRHEQALVKSSGWEEVLLTSGIGGIRSPVAVKCLHLQAAYHLVRPTAVGAWIEARVDLTPCGAEPGGHGSAFASGRGLDTPVG